MQDTPNTGQRLAKVIARAGIESRRGAERLIEAGRVKVNGKAVSSPAINVTANDRIAVDGKALPSSEPPRLWLHHKPAGLVTTARDEKGRATVFDRLPPELPRLMPVGRLDMASEGLLLLTNDGELKRWLEHPSTGWLRRYRVRAYGSPVEPVLAKLRDGITVGGFQVGPMDIDIDTRKGRNVWFTVALRQGRNREIRRAMEAAEMAVNRLIRISYGPFQLGQMKSGEIKEVRRRVLREQVGGLQRFTAGGASDSSQSQQKRKTK